MGPLGTEEWVRGLATLLSRGPSGLKALWNPGQVRSLGRVSRVGGGSGQLTKRASPLSTDARSAQGRVNEPARLQPLQGAHPSSWVTEGGALPRGDAQGGETHHQELGQTRGSSPARRHRVQQFPQLQDVCPLTGAQVCALDLGGRGGQKPPPPHSAKVHTRAQGST